jgi:predicted CXXCH cytochrome family protein
VSPVVMQHRHTRTRRRSPAVLKLIRAAVWMLTLLPAAAPAALCMAQNLQNAGGDDCRRYQDPHTLDLEKKYVHPALDKGCTACHLDCDKVPPGGDRKGLPEFYLKEDEPGLCLSCHTELHPDLSKAHDNQPLDHARCSGCHDAHASNVPKRLPEFSHGPYDARLCSACHSKPVDGKVALVAADINTLCYGCHDDVKMRIEGAKSSHGLLSESNRSCVDCHDSHAAAQEFILTKPVYELCIGCHEGKPEKAAAPESQQDSRSGMPSLEEAMKSSRYKETMGAQEVKRIDLSSEYVHEPVRKSCTLCHDAHASEFMAELRAPVYDLCMDCHGENADKILNSSQPFPLFNGLVSLPPKVYKELPYLDLSSEYVHEPVRTSCVFCHDAHASTNPDELYVSVHNLCIACHGSNAATIMKAGRPFPLFDGRVKLPPNVFEKLSQIHLDGSGGTGHPLQRHPVYIPATDKEPEYNCLTCHTSHASSTGMRRWKGSRDELCHKCHEF